MWVRLRMQPARAKERLRQEARRRPVWLATRGAVALAVLYLLVAWRGGLPPFPPRWERFGAAPPKNFRSVDVAGEYIYAGSTDFGVVRRDPGGNGRIGCAAGYRLVRPDWVRVPHQM